MKRKRRPLVSVNRGVGQLGLEIGVLTDQIVDLLEHGTSCADRSGERLLPCKTAPLPGGNGAVSRASWLCPG